MLSVSIIIPTLNEATDLPRTLRLVRQLQPAPIDVWVADGGSTDDTLAQVRSAQTDWPNLHLICCNRAGRSVQMNQAVEQASGDILCFLHADTALPDDALRVINHTLANPKVAAGGFISIMRGPTQTRWLTSLHNFLKTYYAPLLFRPHLFFFRGARLLFGDQAIFCRRDQFLLVGGYTDDMPIMEEADLMLKLVRYGRVRQVSRVVESSDRRVAKWGFWKANGIYLMIGFLWGIGVSPARLKQWYGDVR